VLPPFEPEPVPVNLVHGASGQMPLKMRRFLDFAARCFGLANQVHPGRRRIRSPFHRRTASQATHQRQPDASRSGKRLRGEPGELR